MIGIFAGITLAPSLHTRLIALIAIEAVLLIVVIASWFKYRQLKHASIDDWFAERDKHASPRVRRMMRESHEQYEAERRLAETAKRHPEDESERPAP